MSVSAVERPTADPASPRSTDAISHQAIRCVRSSVRLVIPEPSMTQSHPQGPVEQHRRGEAHHRAEDLGAPGLQRDLADRDEQEERGDEGQDDALPEAGGDTDG
ncbi:hypothetical protein ACFQ6N_06840 [Kitasatospora sp. NPDC056446]|uniref:hypothetical protein n=1 Tax=Kitasatospora sp. NPDC056446 TaxID=3345819 RepID=UPI0036C5677F